MATHIGTGRGSAVARTPHTGIGRGRAGAPTAHGGSARGRYRGASSTAAQWEIYRGVNALPDFTAPPWETAASLPHTTSGTLAISNDYYFVTRYRNAYGILAKNIAPVKIIRIDGAGLEEALPPRAPSDISIVPAAAGAVTVKAYYDYLRDGAGQATQFLVYLRSDGSDPVPSVDSPTVVTQNKVDAFAMLNWTSGTFADGLTIKVIVRARRIDAGPTNFDSENLDVYATTSDTDGPAAPVGGAYQDGTALA